MKKIMSCIAVCVLAVLPLSAALNESLEAAVLRAQEVQQAQYPMLDPIQQDLFPVYLKWAVFNMNQDTQYHLDPDLLGLALLNSVSYEMQLEKSADGQVPLTPEEMRAVYYAIYSLLPTKHLKGMMPFKEYSEKYRVENWGYFRQASQQALNMIYQAVQDIATQKNNYRFTWLGSLTH